MPDDITTRREGDKLWNLIQRCWGHSPHNRPTFSEIYDELRASFDTGKTMPIAFRRKQLASLAHMIKDNIPRFEDAMKADIGKPPFESQMCSPRL